VKKLKKEVDAVYARRKEFKDKIAEKQSAIKQKQEEKDKLIKSHLNNVRAYKDWKKLNDQLRGLIQDKKAREIEDNLVNAQENRSSEANKKTKVQQEAEKKVDKAVDGQKEAEKKQMDIAKRRRLCEDEYERMQALLKNKPAAARRAPGMTDYSTQTVETPDDPNKEQKQICESLIMLCEKMLPKSHNQDDSPKKKKRRKKKKLKFDYSNFLKFSKVSIGVPSFQTDLEGCIQDLKDKIKSFSEENVVVSDTVDTKDTPN